ncbi:MAG: hypothetical protein HY912_03770 [Desulfomonile tiedjei]|uniref:Uncharacterized protein n=1 Tax=Desulfomonile tiedjei TaxID=2358 RepID=A0A9D6V0S4_9BACT|nr:hypothetical protein [Desulfomonile tiedjei]
MKRLTLVLLCLALLVAALMGIGTRHINDDLYLGFCSGRDTLNGLLGKPDTWSFNTNDEIYVECSWFSYLLYYLAYLKLGHLGPVLIKTVLLSVCLAVLYFRCICLGVPSLPVLVTLILATLSLGPFLLIRGDNFALLYLVLLGTFLTGKTEWGRWRQIGAFIVFVFWINGHGSFSYGFLLIQTRLALEVIAKFWARGLVIARAEGKTQDGSIFFNPVSDSSGPAKSGQIDVTGWFLTAVAAGLALLWFNPYGLMVLRPVRRTMSETFVTNTSLDWLSIPASIYRDGLETASIAFLVFLLCVLVALIIVFMCDGLTCLLRKLISRGAVPIIMELVMAGTLTVLAFRHQRLILLAAFAVVPLSALLMSFAIESAEARFARFLSFVKGRVWNLAALLSGIALVLLSLHFYTALAIRYLPGNPFREDRPIIERLMSFPGYKMEAAEFMKTNSLSGRAFSGWSISIFLLFHHPGVQLFMDCRDSAMYDDDIMKLFLKVLYDSGPNHGQEASAILEQFGIPFVLLDARGSDWNLAVQLMKSKNWLPVYKDEEAVLLVRSDSSVAETFHRTGNLDYFKYDRPETRIMSEALAWLYGKGRIPERLALDMKTIVLHKPEPLLYTLIASAPSIAIRCEDLETKSYLESELSRLSKTNHRIAGGARILESQIVLLRLLSMNRQKCEPRDNDQRFARMMHEQKLNLSELQRKYY